MLTRDQLLNNLKSMERDIQQNLEACRVLAINNCFEQAQLRAVEVGITTNRLVKLFDDFDF